MLNNNAVWSCTASQYVSKVFSVCPSENKKVPRDERSSLDMGFRFKCFDIKLIMKMPKNLASIIIDLTGYKLKALTSVTACRVSLRQKNFEGYGVSGLRAVNE